MPDLQTPWVMHRSFTVHEEQCMPEPHSLTTYAEAGVHLALGDAASQLLSRAARHTREQRQSRLGDIIIPHDDFSKIGSITMSILPMLGLAMRGGT
jgi:hypothetical protein